MLLVTGLLDRRGILRAGLVSDLETWPHPSEAAAAAVAAEVVATAESSGLSEELSADLLTEAGFLLGELMVTVNV